MKTPFFKPLQSICLAAVCVVASGCWEDKAAETTTTTEPDDAALVEQRVQQILLEQRLADLEAKLQDQQAGLEERERLIKEREELLAKQSTTQTVQTTKTVEPAPAAPPRVLPRDEPALGYFYEDLAPHGDWYETSDYGYIWRPAERYRRDSWQPYTDGSWVYTDHGWTWVSDEPFGWATYHYGRWVEEREYGWCWVPDTEWGPAWVSWRSGDDYVGWAPLPPSAHFRDNRISMYVDDYYDVGPEHYTFVPTRHMSSRNLREHYVPRNQRIKVINKTTNITNIVRNNTTIINEGPDITVVNNAGGDRVRTVPIRQRREWVDDNNTAQLKDNVLEVPVLPKDLDKRARDARRFEAAKIARVDRRTGWEGVSEETQRAMREQMRRQAGNPDRSKPKDRAKSNDVELTSTGQQPQLEDKALESQAQEEARRRLADRSEKRDKPEKKDDKDGADAASGLTREQRIEERAQRIARDKSKKADEPKADDARENASNQIESNGRTPGAVEAKAREEARRRLQAQGNREPQENKPQRDARRENVQASKDRPEKSDQKTSGRPDSSASVGKQDKPKKQSASSQEQRQRAEAAGNREAERERMAQIQRAAAMEQQRAARRDEEMGKAREAQRQQARPSQENSKREKENKAQRAASEQNQRGKAERAANEQRQREKAQRAANEQNQREKAQRSANEQRQREEQREKAQRKADEQNQRERAQRNSERENENKAQRKAEQQRQQRQAEQQNQQRQAAQQRSAQESAKKKESSKPQGDNDRGGKKGNKGAAVDHPTPSQPGSPDEEKKGKKRRDSD